MAKVTFKNGSSIELPDGDSSEAGRGLRPFEPHPCQQAEFELRDFFSKFIPADLVFPSKPKPEN